MESSNKSMLHVLVSFPAQGHVNPLLRLAECLVSKGLLVTFSTTQDIGQMMEDATSKTTTTANIGDGQLRFEFFADGWDINECPNVKQRSRVHQLETVGRDSLIRLINQQAQLGRPVSCLINNPFVPWVTDIATELGIPCAVIWVQSCAVYSIYYHYHHQLIASFPDADQPDLSLNLPGLPILDSEDIPSFLHKSSPYASLTHAILGQFKNLEKAFCVLVDSFEELEGETMEAMSHLSVAIRPVGPLFKSPNEDSNVSVRGDMWKAADDCLQWLDSQSPASVVYVSFGITAFGFGSELSDGFIKEAEGKGLVVQWCPQEQVVAHPAVSCFVTHCGWNSSMESLSSGVPVIVFPQWGDQVTNAKFLVDVYGVGVRMKKSTDEKNEVELVTSEEVERCIVKATKGPKAEEMKKNVLKWKKVAEEAVTEGGSSYRNIQAFVDDIHRMASDQQPLF
ncbi:UDP-glucuronosyl/UDP-glucosyltransferase [Macleaya cordata]|uniref:Glycosyltransferase n=1 Tax=Macleaya cordata TaxID=56857 RepID=A0A200PT82_MACCD|nr:UDP-glucuronosyl/UDP-glucosyltransferase [Macleaya cordata]